MNLYDIKSFLFDIFVIVGLSAAILGIIGVMFLIGFAAYNDIKKGRF